jgi:hypothetical protein
MNWTADCVTPVKVSCRHRRGEAGRLASGVSVVHHKPYERTKWAKMRIRYFDEVKLITAANYGIN